METITKGIICHHFWRVMLYTSHAKFYISIIPARWYKDNIMNQLDTYLKSSPVLTAVRPSTETLPLSSESMLTFQSLRQFQELEHNEVICHATPLRNRFGIAFFVSKTAIHIALETNSDDELIRMLKNFITIKRQANKDLSRYNSNDLSDLSNTINEDIKTNNESDEISPLQQQLISQIADPKVTKIRGAPSKKRLKSFTKVLDKRVNTQETNNGEASSKAQ
ncbi:hypothetical protein C2G38_2277415 [Gigaspora rosea]|uniref:Uncharacterized protein n=1 Tax=Gigaspora rosea TaxID=44941 RepID=A0A397UBM1_9GLOM|nr:hypothetical protein C2G38_2277415 [Gigaspora rosea]